MKHAEIMDVTLRDGSYAINYSFSEADTEVLTRELESAGIKYIEVGHGVGLGASEKRFGAAASTDEEYMIAAKGAVSKAKYGMFCIPGIAELKDIDLAAKHDMGFIRVGTNVTEVEQSKGFIKKAKSYGMFVAANYMKSYAITPEQFAQKVKLSESYGADMVYLVDSAGGMFDHHITQYMDAIKSVSNIGIGFHGHANLGLAEANSIHAAKQGAMIVDSSLQGLGRSAGNASTERLVAAMQKQGALPDVDFLRLLRIGHKYVHPLVQSKGHMPLDTVAGFAEFHSSYMPQVQKYAAKYQVDPAMLIIELCKENKVDVSKELLDRLAMKLRGSGKDYVRDYGFNQYTGREQDALK